MAKGSLPKVLHLDPVPRDRLKKDAKDCQMWLIHRCKTPPIAVLDASTAIPMGAWVS